MLGGFVTDQKFWDFFTKFYRLLKISTQVAKQITKFTRIIFTASVKIDAYQSLFYTLCGKFYILYESYLMNIIWSKQ